ncbi:MAG: hypothetical protein EOR03_33460, partial [Mesorhizobium sp.]
SPLAGEMSGRTEGGAVPPTCQPILATPSGCFRLGMDKAESWRSFPPPLPCRASPSQGGRSAASPKLCASSSAKMAWHSAVTLA